MMSRVAPCSALSRTLRAGSAGAASGILDSACARRSADRQVGTKEWSFRSNQGMGSGSGGHWRVPVVGIEQRLALEQRAQQVEQAISDAAQGAAMAVTATAQLGVAATADRIMLHVDARPMIDGVLQPLVAGAAADDEALLAAAHGDRGGARQAAQGVVVSAPQRLWGLGEQRGEIDPADSREGAKDRYVALLAHLPRLALRRGFEPGAELVELAVRLFDLLVDQPKARRPGGNGGAGRFLRARGDRERRLAQ